jgi:secreted trypsin-like serine protease
MESSDTQNIFGGELISADDDLGKSVVAVISDSSNLCTGVLIRRDAVLTAAHCFPQKISNISNISNIKIIFGPTISKAAPYRRVRRVVQHPQAKTSGAVGWNDLAIVFLREPAPMDAKSTTVAQGPLRLQEGDSVQSFGYGISRVSPGVEDSERGAGVLRGIHLLVQNPARSKTEFSLGQGFSEGGVCQGDSGGPVFREKPDGGVELIGIISRASGIFRFSCIIDSIVTRVDTYAVWIQKTLQTSANSKAKP